VRALGAVAEARGPAVAPLAPAGALRDEPAAIDTAAEEAGVTPS
jgi:hypothetical protein